MKRILLLIFLVGLFSNCGIFEDRGSLPQGLYNAKPPLVLTVVNHKGIVVKDANNKLYSYGDHYYFAAIIIQSELQPGDTLIHQIKTDSTKIDSLKRN